MYFSGKLITLALLQQMFKIDNYRQDRTSEAMIDRELQLLSSG